MTPIGRMSVIPYIDTSWILKDQINNHNTNMKADERFPSSNKGQPPTTNPKDEMR
ncbi:MAG: hypothetical protein MnENMB40S_13050 [Rhizobiaceae bacterium MnEN-MB40S]|nr:MAG: hypothetical protein MnENMB40S_13050 [Rhizobiaceae bacterium MnEN-MB40S]